MAGKTLGVSETPRVSIFNIVAIGGMGKSALTWKWFNEIAPQEMKPLAGRMWWSFYESDATFENFVIRALAYVTGRAREDIEKNVKPGEREEQLLAALDHAPFLLVLDGLERILIAYARHGRGAAGRRRLRPADRERRRRGLRPARQRGADRSSASTGCARPRTRTRARSCASWPASAHRACW